MATCAFKGAFRRGRRGGGAERWTLRGNSRAGHVRTRCKFIPGKRREKDKQDLPNGEKFTPGIKQL